MLVQLRNISLAAALGMFVATGAASAGVGLMYGGPGGSSAGQFNFAVSTTEGGGIGTLTSESVSDGGGAVGGHDRRKFDILSLFQRNAGIGGMGFGGNGGGGGVFVGSDGQTSMGGVDINSLLQSLSGAAGQQSGGTQAVNSGYCFCRNNNGGAGGSGGGSGDGGSGGGGSSMGGGDTTINIFYITCDDDDDDGGVGGEGEPSDPIGGDDDDDDTNPGGGMNPSVVPEPGSFALWSLAGALIMGVTRRRIL